MAKILRIVSVERGHDPRDFVLMCFGGAGPMHGCALAEELNLTKIIVPSNPGLFSAHGLLVADFKNSFVKAFMRPVDAVEVTKVEATFNEFERKGAKLLEKQRVSEVNMHFIRQIDLRYFGQSYELTVPTSTPFTDDVLRRSVESFHRKHAAIYGYAVENEPIELVNVRLITTGLAKKPDLVEKPLHRERPLKEATIAKRNVFFEKDGGINETPIFRRKKLKAGNTIDGPAVIEQYDATTIVYPNWQATVDRLGNIVLSMNTGGK